jgi:hypothetical protein
VYLATRCLRMAVTDRNGMVPTARFAELLGEVPDMALPPWVEAWSRAEALRPWPPMQD